MATLTLDTSQRSLLDAVEEDRPPTTPTTPAPGAAAGADRAPFRGAATAAAHGATAAAHGATLDALVARSWSTLRVTRAASCLLCGGEVEPRYGSGPHPVGGTCRSCGTELA